ncbi:MAG: DegT/DnrJ/EryC1/StrS family aminotransferase [Planctomycetes bacterium]|nr:DegT/DnrJ/EryC1/StrS family aminotransferase [Planctomycetota bacterium]
MVVPQIQPWIDSDDVESVRAAVESTFVTEHDRTRFFETRLRELTGARHAIAYANASCALFAVLRALGIGPGHEVIVPDLTFVATANAVILAGATPVFCDVEPETLMLSPRTATPHITPRTRAIIPVHLYGLAADVAALEPLARQHNLLIIEDAAQAVGVRFAGAHAGTRGSAGVISFYGNKTLTTGEGGAILTSDDSLAEAVYRLKNHGRMQKGVFVHEQVGFNFSFTEMQAALGLSQLDKLERVIADKRRIRERYARGLAGLANVRLQQPPPHVEPVFWFTNVFADDAAALAGALQARGIQSRRFFYPLHQQPCYREHLRQRPAAGSAFPNTTQAYASGLSLPSWCGLPDETIDAVCEAITDALDRTTDSTVPTHPYVRTAPRKSRGNQTPAAVACERPAGSQ